MSAYIVSEYHIDAMVSHMLHDMDLRHYLPTTDGSELGQLLIDENRKSVHARYGNVDDLGPYKHRPNLTPGHSDDAMVIAGAFKCYQYQACEHDGWNESVAKDITDRVLRSLLDRLPHDPTKSYWEIEGKLSNCVSMMDMMEGRR